MPTGRRSSAGPFLARLRQSANAPGTRRWIFVPYDQLTDRLGPLSRLPAREAGVVVVESRAKAGRRPYHKHKLAFVLANLRHFCLEQQARGTSRRMAATPRRCTARPGSWGRSP